MIQQADIPGPNTLSDEDIRNIREALICFYRHRVRNRDDLESIVDEAIAVSIDSYDENRIPNSRIHACVWYLANYRLRNLLRSEYRWAEHWCSDEFRGPGLRDYGHAEVALQDTLGQFEERDRQIIKMRMEGRTCKDIGQRLGVSRQRVHQCMLGIRTTLAKVMPEQVAAWQKRQRNSKGTKR